VLPHGSNSSNSCGERPDKDSGRCAERMLAGPKKASMNPRHVENRSIITNRPAGFRPDVSLCQRYGSRVNPVVPLPCFENTSTASAGGTVFSSRERDLRVLHSSSTWMGKFVNHMQIPIRLCWLWTILTLTAFSFFGLAQDKSAPSERKPPT